jgi:hypothetical protein
MAEVDKHGGDYVVCPGTFAEKVNYAYDTLDRAPWVFLTGDDVKFHPGWLDHAQFVAKANRADVVGTNDLGNPRVTSGEHAVHMMIRRSLHRPHRRIVGSERQRRPRRRLPRRVRALVRRRRDRERRQAARCVGDGARLEGGAHASAVRQAPVDDVYRKGEAQAAKDHGLYLKRLAKSTVAVAA